MHLHCHSLTLAPPRPHQKKTLHKVVYSWGSSESLSQNMKLENVPNNVLGKNSRFDCSQLKVSQGASWCQAVQQLKHFFSGFNFTAAQIVCITAMI